MADYAYQEQAFYTSQLIKRTYSINTADIDDHYSVLKLAARHGKLRKIPGVWSIMLVDIINTTNKTIAEVATQLDLSARTLRRLLNGATAMPAIKTSYKIFLLHLQHCGHKYKPVVNSDPSAEQPAVDGR
jgi:AraC-like DNA-binding protein